MHLERAYCVWSILWLYSASLKTGVLHDYPVNTQVNRMSRSRRWFAIGGKQRIFGLDMVCIETILFHLDSL